MLLPPAAGHEGTVHVSNTARQTSQPNRPARRSAPNPRVTGQVTKYAPQTTDAIRSRDQSETAMVAAMVGAIVSAALKTWSTAWRFTIVCAGLSLPFAVALIAYLVVR